MLAFGGSVPFSMEDDEKLDIHGSSLPIDVFSRLIVDNDFDSTIDALRKIDVTLPEIGSAKKMDYNGYEFPADGELVTPISEITKISLKPEKGREFINRGALVAAYDESLFGFDSLEGSAFFFSHALVILGEKDYVPVTYLMFNFYTRSQEIVERSERIKFSSDPSRDSKKDCAVGRVEFLLSQTPPNSVLLIDGPLIAGDAYTSVINAYERFGQENIMPVYFVKNSSSNMVTDNIDELRNKYHSDLHWAYNYLKPGERTSFFQYADRNNSVNSKVFCYLKAFNGSPQRVEMHSETYHKYQETTPEVMDMVQYLLICQGHAASPQVRPIAVAEAYAREVLKLVNVDKIIKNIGLIPTMNQNRFGWGA